MVGFPGFRLQSLPNTQIRTASAMIPTSSKNRQFSSSKHLNVARKAIVLHTSGGTGTSSKPNDANINRLSAPVAFGHTFLRAPRYLNTVVGNFGLYWKKMETTIRGYIGIRI